MPEHARKEKTDGTHQKNNKITRLYSMIYERTLIETK